MACLKKIRKSQKGLIFKKIQFPGLRSFSIMPIPVKNKPFWARRMHECISGDPEQAKNNNNTDFTVRIPAAGAAVRCGTGTLRLQGRVPPVTHQKKSNVWHFLAAASSGFGNDFFEEFTDGKSKMPG